METAAFQKSGKTHFALRHNQNKGCIATRPSQLFEFIDGPVFPASVCVPIDLTEADYLLRPEAERLAILFDIIKIPFSLKTERDFIRL
ncbi:hypothetical protein [Anaeromassilibacillus senegalensis]|uniref:hypothetical protein n=1 Tax=Anaeromassilibacillus senegalensis TaxID=1673717 RepID=UPI000682F349|nr:hypothetical protein [Anaeromassilibacillus senegalensis]